MIEGRIRDFDNDSGVYFATYRRTGRSAAKRAQARFRQSFSTPFFEEQSLTSDVLENLKWGTRVELLDVLSDNPMTKVVFGGVEGFVETAHLVEIAYVDRPANPSDPKKLSTKLDRNNGDDADLLWGDMVQIIERDGSSAKARARGLTGTIDTDDLTHKPLLECYFIDVGQGDGVLIRFPDGRHMLIDGGLARSRQQTGKNASDFIDWKFFQDYGDWSIDLDWMVASHSDSDHFGGLADLVDPNLAAREELDTLAVNIAKFGHPGLSRFPSKTDPEGLGPSGNVQGKESFTRLLGDRADAQDLVDGSGPDGLKMSNPWRSFISRVLDNSADTQCQLIAIPETAAAANSLPLLDTFADCEVRVLGPVTIDNNGMPALPDLTPGRKAKSINTNGHSVCLRLDYGNARILMTGDLNTASMDWLTQAFTPADDDDDREPLEAWACDVAKACHHGSHDVSFKFLQGINAAATVISSGDNEGHAHPRPEIVAASAISGHQQLSDDGDKVVTPLIYMTEIERSVMLAEINRVEIENIGEAGKDVTLLGKPVSEFGDKEFFDKDDLDALADLKKQGASKAAIKAFEREVKNSQEEKFEALEAVEKANRTRSTAYTARPTGVVGTDYPTRSVHRMRMMEKNIYGLVNVRTDGEWIMCASKRDNGERWTIHAFKARF